MTKDTPTFNSPQDEATYWKKLALEYKGSLEETREEFDEFQSSSRELELELERQLEQLDVTCSDLRLQVKRLALENQSLKERLSGEQHEFYTQLQSLQDELVGIKSNKEALAKYIRQLEQANDDLERAKRTTVASLEDFESRLNLAIERNAFLESELDEKETLKEMVQRLKDEARDLRQEVNVKQRDDMPDNDAALHHQQQQQQSLIKEDEERVSAGIDSNKLATQNHINVTHNNLNKCRSNLHSINGNLSMPPSARVSALNIVGDLLRKVGMKIQILTQQMNRANAAANKTDTTTS